MTAVDTELRPYADAFAGAAPTLFGEAHGWLARARRAALSRLADVGFPERREEDWRHTDPAALVRRALPPAAAPAAAQLEGAAAALRDAGLHAAEGARLVFVDGWFAPALSAAGALPAGATVADLAAALVRSEDRVRARLEPSLAAADDGFAALAAAFTSGGAWIELADGVCCAGPIELVFVTVAEQRSSHPRVLVTAGRGARAHLVEHHLSRGEAPALANVVADLVLGPGAAVAYDRLQEQGADAYHLGRVHARVEAGARLRLALADVGARLARCEVRVELAARAQAELSGAYAVRGRRHADHTLRLEHREPGARSDVRHRGLADRGGRGVFQGLVVVHEGAQKTDARMRADALLLDEGAEADARPRLEIYADDVKCAHGATVGQLDQDALFYLRSRGLDAAQARRLLVEAFAEAALARIASPAARARVRRLVDAALAAPRGGEERA